MEAVSDGDGKTYSPIVVGYKHGYHCSHCGKVIKISIFKGTDFCSDNCRKLAGKDVK